MGAPRLRFPQPLPPATSDAPPRCPLDGARPLYAITFWSRLDFLYGSSYYWRFLIPAFFASFHIIDGFMTLATPQAPRRGTRDARSVACAPCRRAPPPRGAFGRAARAPLMPRACMRARPFIRHRTGVTSLALPRHALARRWRLLFRIVSAFRPISASSFHDADCLLMYVSPN